MKESTIEAIIESNKKLGKREAFARAVELLEAALRNASSAEAQYMLGIVKNQIKRELGESK